jgi:hypothetical protein
MRSDPSDRVGSLMMRVTLLTLSFRGDLEFCRLLCETADRFVDSSIRHMIAVPRADLPLFAPLARDHRHIIAQEDLLPGWLIKVPLPSPAWRKRLFLPRRNVYLSLRGRPVRGWIAQQLMKIAAARMSEADIIVHADSDAAFIRPTRPEDFLLDGKPRFLREPGAGDSPMHAVWHQAASRVLGLALSEYHGADYIDSMVIWRRKNVEKMISHIERDGGNWYEKLIRAGDFSEYILYGVFYDKILGDQGEQAPTPCRQSLSLWDTAAVHSAEQKIDSLAHDQLALVIQSTIDIADSERRRIVERAIDKAAEQDGRL